MNADNKMHTCIRMICGYNT